MLILLHFVGFLLKTETVLETVYNYANSSGLLGLWKSECLSENVFFFWSLQLASGKHLAYLVSTLLNFSKYVINQLVVENRKYSNEIILFVKIT